ncbi:hypothetical protein NIA69_12895 [Gemmiger formicilis]|nr:hypothetical protein [Gemmiger formicilis]
MNIRRMIRHEGYTGYLITKAARSEFIQELQIVDEKLFARANEVIDCRSKKLAQEKTSRQKRIIQPYWLASSSAHIAGRRCRPFAH